MTQPTALALCASTPLISAATKINGPATAPEWVHLLPAEGAVQTNDSRAYTVKSLQAVMDASLAAGQKLVIDENHATDLAAPKGDPAPARGWIVALQRRDDGLWGKVEWTEPGKAMVEAKEYRGISPVIRHNKAKEIKSIVRASLVNEPNFTELTALNSAQNGTQKLGEDAMNFMEKLAKALGLGEAAGEDKILAAVAKLAKAGDADDKVETATQAALAPML